MSERPGERLYTLDAPVFSQLKERPRLYATVGRDFMAGTKPVESALRKAKVHRDILQTDAQITKKIVGNLHSKSRGREVLTTEAKTTASVLGHLHRRAK